MPTEQEAKEFVDQLRSNELAHHGVLGQKWGHKKAVAPSGPGRVAGPRKAPSQAAGILLGAYGSKKRYTNAAALQQRTKAGHLRTAAILSASGGVIANRVAASIPHGKIRTGANIVSGLLEGTATGLGVGAYIGGNSAIAKENAARNA